MRRIAILVLIVGSLCGGGFCEVSAVFSSYYSGKRYDFRINPEQLANTPAWLENQPNPPLSARRATEVATGYLKQLFDDAHKWHLNEITLVPLADRWVYLIGFSPPNEGCNVSCLSSPFKVVVMMDGAAVTATISAWNPAK